MTASEYVVAMLVMKGFSSTDVDSNVRCRFLLFDMHYGETTIFDVFCVCGKE